MIDVEDVVKYQAARIGDPDRIYFDLHTAKLSSTLAGKTLEVQGGFLKTIRVAQNQAGVVRVVLEVDKVKDYSVFLLPSPYRLIVDVYGEAPLAAKSTASPVTEAERAAKPGPPPEKTETSRSEKPASKPGNPPPEGAASARSDDAKPAAAPGAAPARTNREIEARNRRGDTPARASSHP